MKTESVAFSNGNCILLIAEINCYELEYVISLQMSKCYFDVLRAAFSIHF